MTSQQYMIALAAIVFLGIAAQWLAWWLRLPAILVLLLFGCAVGPGAQILIGHRFINPDQLLGGMLLPLVSLFVAVILFEGGLTLNAADLSQAGRVIFNLVTIGALITWLVASTAAWLVLELEPPLAILIGAILVVTGPTVIGPLLRHVRPSGQVGPILRWEGIVIDPIGVLLAVVVYEAIPIHHIQEVTTLVLLNVAKTVIVGSLIGATGAALLVVLLRRRWVADYLESPVTLALAIAAFASANVVQRESGLFTVTVMGILLANQKYIPVRHILEFKENLTILLVSCLFILLGARLRIQDLARLDWRILVFLAILILIARPLGILASTRKAGLNWRERIFLMCMAPRGIVAASVSSVFALRLSAGGYANAEWLVPYTFAVIIGTVTIYGLGSGWAARKLGLANPGRRGFLIAGANPLARAIGSALRDERLEVLLVDTNRENLNSARLAGLPTYYASILSQPAASRVELSGIGRLLSLTPNEEVNSLASLQFSRLFGRSEVYQLASETPQRSRTQKVAEELRGRILFAPDATYKRLMAMMDNGATVTRTKLTRDFDFKAFQSRGTHLPLFLIDELGQVTVFTADRSPAPRPGQSVISLVAKEVAAGPPAGVPSFSATAAPSPQGGG